MDLTVQDDAQPAPDIARGEVVKLAGPIPIKGETDGRFTAATHGPVHSGQRSAINSLPFLRLAHEREDGECREELRSRIDRDRFERVFATNVTGPMLMAREAAKHFMTRMTGHIVNNVRGFGS